MNSSTMAMGRLPLCVAIIGLAGAAGCAVEPGGEGSQASNVAESSIVATCNDGDMVVSKLADNDFEYVATIYDQGVVEWFEAQSQLVEDLPVMGEGPSTASVQSSRLSRAVRKLALARSISPLER